MTYIIKIHILALSLLINADINASLRDFKNRLRNSEIAQYAFGPVHHTTNDSDIDSTTHPFQVETHALQNTTATNLYSNQEIQALLIRQTLDYVKKHYLIAPYLQQYLETVSTIFNQYETLHHILTTAIINSVLSSSAQQLYSKHYPTYALAGATTIAGIYHVYPDNPIAKTPPFLRRLITETFESTYAFHKALTFITTPVVTKLLNTNAILEQASKYVETIKNAHPTLILAGIAAIKTIHHIQQLPKRVETELRSMPFSVDRRMVGGY